VEGIWRFLLPEREAYFRQFMREYETVRQAEGRGADDPAYYRALPFEDRTGRFREDWRIRARSFRALVARVVAPLEAERGRLLTVLDLGAGNGWLSYRLAQRGHGVAAVDLLTNAFDGLGAHVHYDVPFTPVQAEFDRLPFADGEADLIVFNASLHYSTSYETTLGEALRVLRRDGRLVIMDSPVYRDPASGEQMVREREAQFEEKYGFPSNALPSENYLTYDRLAELGEALGLRWRFIRPFYGWRWVLRPWKARLLGRREPAQFLVVVGRRGSS
jgi:SAM-dependent methyltransferase